MRWGIPSKLINYKKFNIEICKHGFKDIVIKSKQYHDLNDLNDWKIAENKFKKTMIPIFSPHISSKAKKNVNKALNSNWISSQGRYVSELEKKLKIIIK